LDKDKSPRRIGKLTPNCIEKSIKANEKAE
jgi:hypothetical protein